MIPPYDIDLLRQRARLLLADAGEVINTTTVFRKIMQLRAAEIRESFTPKGEKESEMGEEKVKDQSVQGEVIPPDFLAQVAERLGHLTDKIDVMDERIDELIDKVDELVEHVEEAFNVVE